MSLTDAAHIPDGLTYCSDEHPGLRRTASGKGFAYHDRHGAVIRDEKVLDRIHALAIPPAWTEVWICPDERGHIQAVGRDAKGRKQYRYHDKYRESREKAKYEHVIDFAQALPKIRQRVQSDMAKTGLPREKVIATVPAVIAYVAMSRQFVAGMTAGAVKG